MWVPVIAGVGATIYGLWNLFEKPFCQEGVKLGAVGPNVNGTILYEYNSENIGSNGEPERDCRESALPVVLEETMNTGATPIAALVLCVWCAFFLEKWVRREHSWAAYWHTAKGKWLFSNPSRLRPGFRATLKPPGSEMTVPQGYEPLGTRMKKLLASYVNQCIVPLATENLLENTVGYSLREGGGAPHRYSLRAAACYFY